MSPHLSIRIETTLTAINELTHSRVHSIYISSFFSTVKQLKSFFKLNESVYGNVFELTSTEFRISTLEKVLRKQNSQLLSIPFTKYSIMFRPLKIDYISCCPKIFTVFLAREVQYLKTGFFYIPQLSDISTGYKILYYGRSVMAKLVFAPKVVEALELLKYHTYLNRGDGHQLWGNSCRSQISTCITTTSISPRLAYCLTTAK